MAAASASAFRLVQNIVWRRLERRGYRIGEAAGLSHEPFFGSGDLLSGSQGVSVSLRTTPLIDYREGIMAARITAMAGLAIAIAGWVFLSL
jgi:hypothetical protein